MVKLNRKFNNITHLGGGDLSNPTITLKEYTHEKILESPSF